MSTKDGRGFNEYGIVNGRNDATILVKESSIAFEGAHVWIFSENPAVQNKECAVQINVKSAKQLISCLQEFVTQAEAGELTEPAGYEEESN